jgi:hypothetical protein
MNIELLQKVKAHILEEPKRFNLHYWGGIIDPSFYGSLGEKIDDYGPDDIETAIHKQHPPCGAVGCIAGNILILAGQIKPTEHYQGIGVYKFPENTLELAADALGIDEAQAKRLFFLYEWGRMHQGRTVGWPEPFEDRLYDATPGTLEYAQITAERIDHFIATNGAE